MRGQLEPFLYNVGVDIILHGTVCFCILSLDRAGRQLKCAACGFSLTGTRIHRSHPRIRADVPDHQLHCGWMRTPLADHGWAVLPHWRCPP